VCCDVGNELYGNLKHLERNILKVLNTFLYNESMLPEFTGKVLPYDARINTPV